MFFTPQSLYAADKTLFDKKLGSTRILVTRSPTPPTIDNLLKFNILLTEGESAKPITDANVVINPNMPGMPMPGVTQIVAHSGNNPGEYLAEIPVNMEGYWQFQVTITSKQAGTLNFMVSDTVAKPEFPWLPVIIIIIGLPIVMVLGWVFYPGRRKDLEEE